MEAVPQKLWYLHDAPVSLHDVTTQKITTDVFTDDPCEGKCGDVRSSWIPRYVLERQPHRDFSIFIPKMNGLNIHGR
jgi:hypothetical protein